MSTPEPSSTAAVAPRPDVADDEVPLGLRIAGAFSWRVLVVVAGLALVAVLVVRVADVAVPFLVGLILSALLVPFARFLERHRWPRWLAVVSAWVLVFAALAVLVTVVTVQVRYDLPSLEERVRHTTTTFQALLATHPFGLTPHRIDQYVAEGTAYLQKHSSSFLHGASTAGSTLAHVLEGVFIVVFTTLFALIDGGRIWNWVVRLFPAAARVRLEAAGAAGWRTLSSFIRVQLVVAVTDAIGIGAGAAFLGVPLAVPIAVIVFIGAFVPVVGAIVGGIVAVVIALLFNGVPQALGVLGVVILVQQLESHVLHPLLTGSAVKVHPLGIVLGVATGASVAGIAGAFFAVPFIATVNAMVVAAAHADPEELTGAGHDPDPEARSVRRR
ncbi:AI-2E family transporter [Curtobacterium sp. RRHDQ10]|uniref:AI-2E family transporter n=1 Tax=Curtobacterium phyllosphaerae TaxID=3413379 RepID=UPI003BF31EB6